MVSPDGMTPAQIKAAATQSLKRLRDQLGSIDRATCQVNLVKSTAKPTEKNTRFVDMRKALAQHFKEAAATNLQKIISDALSDTEGVSNFDHQAFADGRIAALPISRFPEVKKWFDELPADDVVKPLKPDDNHVPQLKFTTTIITFAPKGETIRIFRKASESRLAKRGVIASLVGGTEYDYVDAGTSLIFDMLNDFFVWEDLIFVANYRSLEAILNFREITMTVANGVCDQVFAILPVTGADGLRKAILAGARQLNKMARLKTKPHIPKLDMTKVQVVITKAKLPLKIIDVDGTATLEIDSSKPEHIVAFMHVLSDDYVKSMMTEIEYIVGEQKEVLA